MSFEPFLTAAIDARASLTNGSHDTAYRLFNGFTEGAPLLALDVYGQTVVINDHSESTTGDEVTVKAVAELVRSKLPWLKSGLWKVRNAKDEGLRNGSMLFGTEKELARRIVEDGVTYALDLRMNRDSSLYLDTRLLRAWAKKTLGNKRVLNTFSYTGSLGIAARAAGAVQVMHTDLNNSFLTVAKDTYSMNGWPIAKRDFRVGDFFDGVGALSCRTCPQEVFGHSDLLFDGHVASDAQLFERGHEIGAADEEAVVDDDQPPVVRHEWANLVEHPVEVLGEVDATLFGD